MTAPTTRRLLLLALLTLAGCGAEGDRATAPDPEVLAQAQAYLDTDRPWSAARLLRPLQTDDLEARLLSARAEAGSGEWDRVLTLLDDVGGLDSLDDARGLYLRARAHDHAGDLEAARADYDAYLSAAAPDQSLQRDAAGLRRALVLVRLDPDAGSRALEDATAIDPGWRAVLQAEALAQVGDARRVEALAGRVSSGEPGRRMWAARIEAARQAGDLEAAQALARTARARVSTDDARAGFALSSAQLTTEMGDPLAARALLRETIRTAPASAAARGAARSLRQGDLEADDHLALAETDRALGLNGDAADAFLRWLEVGQGTPDQQTNVRLEAADALFDAQRYDDVEDVLAPVMDRADARELWAGTLGRMGRTDAAAALYLDLAAADPAPNLYFAADVLQEGGDMQRAMALFRRVEQEHPGTRWAGLATMRRAGQAFLEGDYAQAAALWDGYRTQQPNGPHALRSRYWAGRALTEAGDLEAGQARFRGVLEAERDSYYALRASQALGEPFWPLPMSPSPPADPAAAQAVATAFRGVDVLREAGFPDVADAHADRVAGRLGNGQAVRYALAEALIERGYGQRAIRIGLSAGGGTNERRLRILYPFPFRRMIAAEAQANGVDPFVAAALIRQESQFSARATSHVGARGLMQLMPATGRALALEDGIEDWDPDLLYLPEVNVHLGTRYVGQQAAAYDGSLPAVFGAYNAGPHQVDAWRDFPAYGRDALFTERIPFRETRDYVKILTRNRAVYQGLYGSP